MQTLGEKIASWTYNNAKSTLAKICQIIPFLNQFCSQCIAEYKRIIFKIFQKVALYFGKMKWSIYEGPLSSVSYCGHHWQVTVNIVSFQSLLETYEKIDNQRLLYLCSGHLIQIKRNWCIFSFQNKVTIRGMGSGNARCKNRFLAPPKWEHFIDNKCDATVATISIGMSL